MSCVRIVTEVIKARKGDWFRNMECEREPSLDIGDGIDYNKVVRIKARGHGVVQDLSNMNKAGYSVYVNFPEDVRERVFLICKDGGVVKSLNHPPMVHEFIEASFDGIEKIKRLIKRAMHLVRISRINAPSRSMRKRVVEELRVVSYRAFTAYRSEFYNKGMHKSERLLTAAHRASTRTESDLSVLLGNPMKYLKRFLKMLNEIE